MPPIVIELQQDATEGNDLTKLLRRAMVVARKLNLTEFGGWVDLELNGYLKHEVPNYRKTRGEVVLEHAGVCMPYVFGDPEMGETVSTYENRSPIGALVDLAQRNSNLLLVEFPIRLQNLLLEPFSSHALPPQGMPKLRIGRPSIIAILDAVRTTILDWSLKLESDGILGEGMTFSADEKEAAHANADDLAAPIQINITNVGSMDGSAIQQGTAESSQS